MDAYAILEQVRAEKPLVHHITNWVTIYECAAVTRSTGALPVMAHAEEEVADMTSISGALVLNIGTLTPQLVAAMKVAGRRANERGIPVVLDAVGAGATPLRTRLSRELLDDVKFAVIKGNVSEIGTLAGAKAETRGVEAAGVEGDPAQLALRLARDTGATVAITGKRDIVAGPNGRLLFINNGHELMGRVVGTGCMAASVIGAFCAVEKDPTVAAATALACYGVAGEIAARTAHTPMAFKSALIDAVGGLAGDEVRHLVRITTG
jgi:hydroxyethylthiazole kinase